MKCTLKNRPKTLTEAIPIGDKDLFKFMLGRHREFAKWFLDFEARQRQNLADYEKALKTKKNWDKEFLACWRAISNYIQLEVLGTDAFRPPIIDGQIPDKRFKLSQTKRGKLKLTKVLGVEPKIKEETGK